MDFFDRLELARARWNVLEHPFYVRWSAGELTRGELAAYAGEYRHAVAALSDCLAGASRFAGSAVSSGLESGDPAARHELELHAREEEAHCELWEGFAGAVGADGVRPPLPETRDCVAAWTAGRDLLESLAVAYAVESGQPEISRTKLDGLVSLYGFEEGPATAYFSLHARLDEEHAARSRAMIEERATPADADRLVTVAEGALRGNWLLLDGLERVHRR